MQTCDTNGSWGTAVDCVNKACLLGACTGNCAPGNTQCSGNGVQTCQANGQWGTVSACVDQACVAGACTGVCTPGKVQCSGNGVQTCGSNGLWGTAVDCGNKACVQGVCIGVCAPGTTQCSGNGVQTCQANGQWGAVTPCVDQACVAGTCTGVCAPTAKRCNGNDIQVCQQDGQWSTTKSCGALEQCFNAQMCTAKSVPVTGGYSIDATEVTRDQYASWIATNPSTANQLPECSWNTFYTSESSCLNDPHVCQGAGCGNHPQACLDWCDAYAYCKGVGKRLCGKVGGGPNDFHDLAVVGKGQWFDACTSDGANDYPYGDAYQKTYCNGYDLAKQMTTPVGYLPLCQSSQPGFTGVYDLSGNVLEWEDSCATLEGYPSPQQDYCRTRGGEYEHGGGSLRCDVDALTQWGGAWRFDRSNPFTGFRCCSDDCVPGAKLCDGNVPKTCDANGQWTMGTACSGTTPVCKLGDCEAAAAGPSCSGLAPKCGPNSNGNCCESLGVPGGTFNRSSDSGSPATVSDFVLDSYEITVGRFRKFVAAYSQNMTSAGAGKNPNDPADTGWDSAWNTSLPANASALATALKCDATFQTWTDAGTGDETRPINCLTWYEALAFCIWDGGRLPTEAEWNYAAAGGSEQRTYPWGSTVPGPNTDLAIYGCYYNGPTCTTVANIAPVGFTGADGKWGQADLAGNLHEWVRDSYAAYVTPCKDCANLTHPSGRVVRGGSFSEDASHLATALRNNLGPTTRSAGFTARCARIP